MVINWTRAGAGIIIFGGIAGGTAAMAGPSMSSSWLNIELDQNACVAKGKAAVHKNSFNTRFEVISNRSIFGERGGYTVLVRCASEKKIAYFVVAGPNESACDRYMNAIKNDF